MENATHVHFVEEDSGLTTVEIGQPRRSPLISKLHRVFFTLGIVVSSYQVRALSNGIVERIVIQRRDGTSVNGELGALARAAVLPIALASDGRSTSG